MARVWVKGYTKDDGTKVPGHYRETSSRSGSKKTAYAVAKGRKTTIKMANNAGFLKGMRFASASFAKFKQTGKVYRRKSQ